MKPRPTLEAMWAGRLLPPDVSPFAPAHVKLGARMEALILLAQSKGYTPQEVDEFLDKVVQQKADQP